MKPNSRLVFAVVLACCFAGSSRPVMGADFADLIKQVPATANALVMVNAEAILNSPIAKRENWQADREKRFSAGLTSMPPKASRMLLAANIDVEAMTPTWEAAIVEMDSQTLMSSLANRLNGSLGKVYDKPMVRLPDNTFVVQFAKDTFGTMAPASRQEVSRWVAQMAPKHSAFLNKGVGYADSTAAIIMLLDLQNAFSANELAVEKLESVRNSDIDKEKLAELLASVQGLMLGIRFNDKANASLRIDFGQDPALMAGIAKPLVLDLLGAYGVMIDEVADWKASVKGKTIFISGPLSFNGLTRLASLTRLPSPALHAGAQSTPADATDTEKPAPQQSVLQTTQQYYSSVTHLIENLEGKKRDMKTMGQLAQWFENYGRHVDQLPTLGVDKEMLEYGAYISGQMHAAAMGLKGITIAKRPAEVAAANSSQIYGGALGNISQQGWQQGYSGYYGRSYGGNYGRVVATNAAYGIAGDLGAMGAFKSGLRQQQQARTEVRVQATAQGATGVQQILQNIQTATTQVRRSMTDKYQVQF